MLRRLLHQQLCSFAFCLIFAIVFALLCSGGVSFAFHCLAGSCSLLSRQRGSLRISGTLRMGGPGFVDGEEREEFAFFLPCRIEKEGIVYPSAEHFFQTHNTLDWEQRKKMAQASFESIYALGRCLNLRSDWEVVKLRVMLDAAEMKYAQNSELREVLLGTRGDITFSPSAGFWGVDHRTGCGENWNGRIHMAVKARLSGDEALYSKLFIELDARCQELTGTK
eukprot:TRINITY_DN47316_c0_g1_i1.p1 TRINITY_DN47316_c0_g1~~TRINITY_DN47316_c0_g1_i1.p1  ORF type:complete len:223 (+),score=32.71 TRINITY_DN47316_c0_g1_i1:19-687(+)